MASCEGSSNLRGAAITDVDLSGARITGCDLSGVVMRGVALDDGLEIDSPWLFEGRGVVVNGVDVTAFVDAELNRRFPGRSVREAADPEGLRAAWTRVQEAWADAVARVKAMPEGTAQASVEGEWSFVQTLRHLVFATDVWLGTTVLGSDDVVHPIGQVDSGTESDGRLVVAREGPEPSLDEVLAVRASRVEMVADFLEAVTPEMLAESRPNPHDAEHSETVLACLHTIIGEEWEHLRYALRDLAAIEARGPDD